MTSRSRSQSEGRERARGHERSTVRLRPLETRDFDRIHTWHNDASLYEFLIGTCRFPDRNATRRWLDERIAATDSRSFAICIAADAAEERHVGNLYLRAIGEGRPGSRDAELEIFLGAARDRGRGIGRRAVWLALEHAFEVLALDSVFLRVLADNEPAIRAYRACGFVEEPDPETDSASDASVMTMRCRRP